MCRSCLIGVGRFTSVCDSHPYFIRVLNFPSISPCSCEVCKIKQLLWTMERFQKLSCHRTPWPMFTCSVEQRNSRSSWAWNRKSLNRQWRILETVCLSICSPSIQSNSCQNGMTKLMNLGQCWSSVIIWIMVHALFGIIAWLCWIHKQIWAQYPTNKKLRRWIWHRTWQLIFWTVFSIQILTTDNP